MDSLKAIVDDLVHTLDVELQEGRHRAEVEPAVLRALASGRAGAAAAGGGAPHSAGPAAPGAPGVNTARASVSPGAGAASAPAHFAPQPHVAASSPAKLMAVLERVSTIEEVADLVAVCQLCHLAQGRNKAVPGEGPQNPDIMFVGEGPGADEDASGRPFVGRAGQLLTKMIEAMGYKREEVFIANVVKCRPPGNRTPTPPEMATCLPYLRRQIALVRPKVIVCLGGAATQCLLGTDKPISQIRGQWHKFDNIPVMPTFHPAYLMRFPTAKTASWADLRLALKHLGRTPPSHS